MLKPIFIIVLIGIVLGLLANIIFFCWAIKNYKRNEMNNLPPGINDPANDQEIRYKKCPECNGRKYILVSEWIGILQGRKDCWTCKGTGRIELSFEEIIEEKERKMENQSNL